MKPKYIPCDGYTVVLTPHFRQQVVMRARLLEGASPFGRGHFDAIFIIAKEDDVVGYKHGSGYVYARKKYNIKRFRWELEYISLTPGDFFKTKTNQTAKLIAPSF